MSLLAQIGFGRGSKVEDGFDEELIEGVVMSPRDENRARLESFVNNELPSKYEDYVAIFDPQFYVSTLPAPRDGHLQEYDYYANNNSLGRTQFSASRIRGYVEECLGYQHDELGDNLTYVLSPTIMFDDFTDSWSQIALDLAVESCEHHTDLETPKPLLVSLCISESALRSTSALDEYLDAVTELEAEGFYILVKRDSASVVHSLDKTQLANLMYLHYVLAEVNEYTVVAGYTDWYGFLLKAVGTDYVASGWYQNLRQFSMARFMPATQMRHPRKRYSSLPLLSNPLLSPELEDVALAGLLDLVLSGSSFDDIISDGPASALDKWTDPISCLAHWYSLSRLLEEIEAGGSISSRLNQAQEFIDDAQAIYNRLGANAIVLGPSTGPGHLQEWDQAVKEFRLNANI